MNIRRAFSLPTIIVVAFLSACGGGGGSNSPVPQLVQGPGKVDGQIIVPEIPTADSGVVAKLRQSKAQGGIGLAAEASACDTIPPGYRALADATVEAKDQDNNVVQTFTTDTCGAFDVTLPANVTSLSTTLTGYQPLSVDVAVFSDTEQGKLASMLPTGAEYQISSLQYVGNNRVVFSVVDSVSRRAVIGLPQSAFTVAVNSVDQPIQDISSVAATNSEASVVLVMDASGSMVTSVTPDLDRIDLASIAAHTFIDGKGAADETGFVIFGSSFDRITSDFLENTIPLQDSSGTPVPWQFTDSGFVDSNQTLHRVADAYNRNSELYGAGGVALHAESGDVLTSERYPFGGTTALWDGVVESTVMLGAASNGRQLIVAMTDGRNNSSSNDVDDAIAQAQQVNVPVHTIGFGDEGDVNVDELTRLANETGGEFQRVEDEQLADLYQNIQLGVRFQYEIETVALNIGDVVGLNIANGDAVTVSRSVTIQ